LASFLAARIEALVITDSENVLASFVGIENEVFVISDSAVGGGWYGINNQQNSIWTDVNNNQ
jgi:hypothetical protein